jgi:Flp pilus assembly pilin Flp
MYARAAHLLANLHISGRRLFASQSGSTAVEYGLIVTCIAITLIVSLTTLGSGIGARLQYFADFFGG